MTTDPHPGPPPQAGEGEETLPCASGGGWPRPRPGGGTLLRLLAWLSPSFPTGGYTYSHGIEAAVEQGLVRDRDSLVRWIAGIMEHGAGKSDAVLFAHAHRAVMAGDEAGFARIVEWADALRGTREMALESSAQGTAFLATVRAAWDMDGLARWSAVLAATGRPPAHPVAVALSAALAGIAVEPALAGFLHAVAANLVSAGVRLIPLGQTDGQRALAALEPVVEAGASAALTASLDDLGSAAPMVDWTSMIHETQYTRLFRS